MSHKITLLDTGRLSVDAGDYVQYRMPGTQIDVPAYSYVIEGPGIDPVLVDTGVGNTSTEKEKTAATPGIETALNDTGLRPKDIRYLIHTHLHADHVGQNSLFPNTTTLIVNRRELEFACSGMMLRDYRLSDLLPIIDRVHAPQAAWLLDLRDFEPVEILPGITVVNAGAHTEGSINILVETTDGRACLCGDLIQDVDMQLTKPLMQMNYREPWLPANTAMPLLDERKAIKRTLASCDWLLPTHDRPAKIVGGLVCKKLETNSRAAIATGF
ncbi:N-acyl homoserine lactonase family protein [Pseudorhodoplanes sp.]|uniref:N-acyl homoserine lactonase family protein n=1 Tax=Pseudorhodoplanes sp. TaxID=1934341 RepID=UPI003D11FCE5